MKILDLTELKEISSNKEYPAEPLEQEVEYGENLWRAQSEAPYGIHNKACPKRRRARIFIGWIDLDGTCTPALRTLQQRTAVSSRKS
jgi:hypothetical protein